MVRRLHLKAHILQRQHNIAPCILTVIKRSHIKKSCLLIGICRGSAILICIKQKELTLRPHFKGISHLGSFPQRFLEDITAVTLKRSAVCAVYIADKARHFSLLGSPWKDCKRVQVRIQKHVRIVRGQHALDKRTVKHTVVAQRLFKLA